MDVNAYDMLTNHGLFKVMFCFPNRKYTWNGESIGRRLLFFFRWLKQIQVALLDLHWDAF